MNSWQIAAVIENYHRLVCEIPTERVLDLLLYDRIITEETIKSIMFLPACKRNDVLLKLMIDIGPGAFACFLHALSTSGSKDLVDVLTVNNTF